MTAVGSTPFTMSGSPSAAAWADEIVGSVRDDPRVG